MSLGDSPGYGCDPSSGDEGKICDCLGCALESIAASTADIARILDERLGRACDNIDECIEEILDKLKERIEGPLYSVSECQRMAESGMAGTIEYAVRCARETIGECETECSLGDPSTEGQCCNTCGESPCCCREGECVPCGTEEETRRYVGWCDPATKVVVVTRQGEPSPGPTFEQVSLSDSEQVAFLEAQSRCESIILTRPPAPLPEIPPTVPYPAPICDLDSYASGKALADIAANSPGRKALASMATITRRVRQVGFEGLNLGLAADIIQGIGNYFTSGIPLVSDDYIPSVAALIGCDNPAFVESSKVLAAAGLAHNLAGVDFTEFLTPYRYAMNAACRQKQLDPDKAIAAFLANAITPEQLDTLWSIHGICNPALNDYVQAARSKPLPLQLAIMRHREIISAPEYHARMRELGYLESSTRENLFNVTYQVPTLTDITRLMVRDADDEELVQRFNLDAQFEQKYGGQLRKWSQDQGVPELFAKYYWRAHWSIPSPTALFTFYHRLRNDQKFGGPDKLLEDVRAALVQQDILPYWIDHYLAVSFHPMRLRDIRRSYQIGTLTEDEAKDAFTQLGYSDKTVELMTRFLNRLRDNSVKNSPAIKRWYRFQSSRDDVIADLKRDNIPDDVITAAFDATEAEFIKSDLARAYVRGDISKDSFTQELSGQGVRQNAIDRMISILSLRKHNHPALADYDVGIIDSDDARQQMTNDGVSEVIATRLIENKDRELTRERAVACQRGIKRRFLMGELDAKDSISELSNYGTTQRRAGDLVDGWQCELKAGERNVSGSTLCEWLARGAITAIEFMDRLERIGYTKADAALMLDDCLIKVSAKQLAQAKKEAREHAAEQTRIQRILDRQARDQAANERRLIAMREKANRTRANRERQLYSAVDKITDKCNCTLSDAINLAKSELTRIRNDKALTIDQSLQALLLAAEEFPPGANLSELPVLLDTIASAIVTADLNGVSQPSGSNGSVGSGS